MRPASVSYTRSTHCSSELIAYLVILELGLEPLDALLDLLYPLLSRSNLVSQLILLPFCLALHCFCLLLCFLAIPQGPASYVQSDAATVTSSPEQYAQ